MYLLTNTPLSIVNYFPFGIHEAYLRDYIDEVTFILLFDLMLCVIVFFGVSIMSEKLFTVFSNQTK